MESDLSVSFLTSGVVMLAIEMNRTVIGVFSIPM